MHNRISDPDEVFFYYNCQNPLLTFWVKTTNTQKMIPCSYNLAAKDTQVSNSIKQIQKKTTAAPMSPCKQSLSLQPYFCISPIQIHPINKRNSFVITVALAKIVFIILIFKSFTAFILHLLLKNTIIYDIIKKQRFQHETQPP